jgi:hypothetical protein
MLHWGDRPELFDGEQNTGVSPLRSGPWNCPLLWSR